MSVCFFCEPYQKINDYWGEVQNDQNSPIERVKNFVITIFLAIPLLNFIVLCLVNQVCPILPGSIPPGQSSSNTPLPYSSDTRLEEPIDEPTPVRGVNPLENFDLREERRMTEVEFGAHLIRLRRLRGSGEISEVGFAQALTRVYANCFYYNPHKVHGVLFPERNDQDAPLQALLDRGARAHPLTEEEKLLIRECTTFRYGVAERERVLMSREEREFSREYAMRFAYYRGDIAGGSWFLPEEIIDVDFVGEGATIDGRHVLLQTGVAGCVPAAAMMIIADQMEDSLRPPYGYFSAFTRIDQMIEHCGFHVHREDVNSLEGLQAALETRGSACVVIERTRNFVGAGGHEIVVDRVTDTGVQIRDPWHAWSLTLTREAFLAKFPSGFPIGIVQIEEGHPPISPRALTEDE